VKELNQAVAWDESVNGTEEKEKKGLNPEHLD
jgi:hypothetical protein